MNLPYTPLQATLDLDRERRPDPRVLAVSQGATLDRQRFRQRIGAACIRLGRWIQGDPRDLANLAA